MRYVDNILMLGAPGVLGVIYNVNETLFVVKDYADLIQKHIATSGQWEPELVNVIRSVSQQITHQKKKCHLVNVGAHIGSICIACANCCSHISAFEPVKSNFEHLNLHRNLNSVSHMTTYNFALSDHTHTSKIVYDQKNTGGCHVVSEYEIEKGIKHAQNHLKDVEVNCIRLDDVHFNETIDLMLIDIEGHEERFLKGAKETLKKNLPVIIIEIWTDEKRQHENMSMSQQQMVQKISELGYNNTQQIGIDMFLFYVTPHD